MPNIDLATFSGGSFQGFEMNGAAAVDYSGRSVSAVGDVNNDGISCSACTR